MASLPGRRCSRCQKLSGCDCRKQGRRLYDQRRGTRQERGYDAAWQAFRLAYIATVVADEPFCQDCGKPFMSTAEIELHHVKKVSEHPELRLERSNIKHLCHDCHSKRTARGE